MRRAAALAGGPWNPVQPGAIRPGRGAEAAVAELVERDVVEPDDVRGPLARLGELELADLGLDLPRVVHAPLGPDVAEPHGLRARQPAVLDRMPGPEDDVLEPVGPALERVLEVVRDLDDRVAGTDLADRLVLPEEARAREHERDLLREPVRVRRRREASGLDKHTVESDSLRTGRVAQLLPGRGHRALLATVALDVVPVHRPHRATFKQKGPGGRRAPSW